MANAHLISVTFTAESRAALEAQMRDFVGLSAASITSALRAPNPTASTDQEIFGGTVSEPVFGQQPVPLDAAPSGADAEASASAPEESKVTVPTPPSAAPSAPAPPAAVATRGPAEPVDAAGLPWDERIHASSCAKIADGTWRKKRGVPEERVASVEAELRAEFPAATPVPPVAAVPTPPAAGSGLQFGQITSRVTVALANKTLTGPDLIAKLKGLGVENLAALDKRPDLWQAALDTLGV